MATSLHSRLVAAMPRVPTELFKAFDLDDMVQKKARRQSSGLIVPGGARGLVVRTYRGILDGSEDEDPDSMNPEAHEVQVAWADGTVENIARDQIELVDRPFYAGDLVVAPDGKSLGLVVEVEQRADVRLVSEGRSASRRSSGLAPSPEGDSERGVSAFRTRGSGALLPRSVSAAALPLAVDAEAEGPVECVKDIQIGSLEVFPLPDAPPLLRPLQAFEVGTPVVKDGHLGAVVSCKVDYLIQLDSGHEFTFEYGMEGVRPEPRQGYPIETYGMYPSQRVYVTGEWLRGFQQQLQARQRRNLRAQNEEESAGASRLCRGVVKSFAVRSVKVNWLLENSESWASAPPAHPVASQASEHDCSELLPLQQFVLRLGQPVYVNVRHAPASASTPAQNVSPPASSPHAKPRAAGAEAAAAVAGGAPPAAPLYRLGMVASLATSCYVLWGDGSVSRELGCTLTPVNVDRVPLSQAEYVVNLAILPHMYVTRKWRQEDLDRAAQEEEEAERRARAAGPPWWIAPYFGGTELDETTRVPEELKAVEVIRALSKVCREMGLADGLAASLFDLAPALDDPQRGRRAGTGRERDHDRDRVRRAPRRDLAGRERQAGPGARAAREGDGRGAASVVQESEGDEAEAWEDCGSEEDAPNGDSQGYESPAEELPGVHVSRLLASTAQSIGGTGLVTGASVREAVTHLQELFKCLHDAVGPGNLSVPIYKRVPVLRSARLRSRALSPEDEAPARLHALVGGMLKGELRRRELFQLIEFIRMAGPGGAGSQGGVGSAGSWSDGNARGHLDPEQIQGIINCVMALRGEAAVASFRTLSRNPANARSVGKEVGVVVRVDQTAQTATVAWLKDPDAFFERARRLRMEIEAETRQETQGDVEAQKLREVMERQLGRFGIAVWGGGRPQSSSRLAGGALYAEAAAEYARGGYEDVIRVETVPVLDVCPMSRFLFFPGDCALLVDPEMRKTQRGEDAPKSEAGGAADAEEAAAGSQKREEADVGGKKVYLEVIAACGGLVWCRTLDGRVAPFAPNELVPLNTRWCDEEPSYEQSSDEGSEYTDSQSEGSDEDDWDDDEGDSGSFGSTNVTDLSDAPDEGTSRCSSPARSTEAPQDI
ncbi:hypothetical protein BESB_054500 [Besnoitia besnoiti]|uniref:Uncharacterized protein n=1 Tax=Besnoitia besnoiti TaxID=94643 RepID=A0A2A9MD43_BESBE|nr:hypothetical protein BESB_054500 [Besnoitia besnoiti]PFH35799.1 hypothetical protein BESB_054500 [Besnoitia besnoiti]